MFGHFDFSWLYSWLIDIWNWLAPNPEFLSYVVTFYVAIIAFLVPLSINTVAKLSERYNSDVITRSFVRSWQNKLLPPLLLIGIALAIILRFVFDNNASPLLWKIIPWATFGLMLLGLTLVLFLYIVFMTWKVVSEIQMLMSNTDKVTKRLHQKIKKFLGKQVLGKKIATSKIDDFFRFFQAIGDILVFEIKRHNNNSLIMSELEKIGCHLTSILPMREKYPDECFSGFSVIMDQIFRVYEATVDSKNEEVCKKVTMHINKILETLSSQENNYKLIDRILQNRIEMAKVAIRQNYEFAYSHASQWYTSIVFGSPVDNNNLHLSYLDLFNRLFFLAARYVVSYDKFSVFYVMTKSLVDDVRIYDKREQLIRKYKDAISNALIKVGEADRDKLGQIEKQALTLINSKDNIHTQKQLCAWLKKLDQLKDTIRTSELSDKQLSSVQEKEKKLKCRMISQFKYKKLLEVILAIGAYCLFKKKYNYIKNIWECKQLPDSGKQESTPPSLCELVKQYFRSGAIEMNFPFWEECHESRKYYRAPLKTPLPPVMCVL